MLSMFLTVGNVIQIYTLIICDCLKCYMRWNLCTAVSQRVVFCQLVSMLCAARSLLNLVAHCQKLQTTVTDRITKTQWLGCLVDFYGLNWFHLNAIFLVHENISERIFFLIFRYDYRRVKTSSSTATNSKIA